MVDDLHDFEAFMKRREEASQAFVRGDGAPLNHLVARISPATFFGPRGGHVKGAENVATAYEQGARAFTDGESTLETLHMGASQGLAYWIGIQRGTAKMGPKKEPATFNLRITEVFRREGSDWKLVHRHADPHVNEIE
ncbi:YybH family protein [Pendulispora albinea]|uniref:Nuclear transport factor 2 family protein n=1 Tax=Pendulispora albinea TaxID=2741071 RepID=A0ABZ2LW20_9BACT